MMLDTAYIQNLMRFLPMAQQAIEDEPLPAVDFSQFDKTIEAFIARPEQIIQEISILKNAIKNGEKELLNSKKHIDEALSESLSEAARLFDQKANNYTDEIFEIKKIYNEFTSDKKMIEKFSNDKFKKKIDAVEAAYRQAVEECLEFSLFLRASADRFRDDMESIPYFDDPQALSNYLRKAIA